MALSRHWTGPFAWFNPEQRGILPLETFHIPRRLQERVRSRRFRITTDRAFAAVMAGCALPRPGEGDTWINQDMMEVYAALHSEGHAHSVEAWLEHAGERRLVGGIYGVHIGAAFFAESKFCRPDMGGRDASKVCLAHLVLHLRRRGFRLLDVQYWNQHLEQFGCEEIPRAAYLSRLAEAVEVPVEWEPFDAESDAARV